MDSNNFLTRLRSGFRIPAENTILAGSWETEVITRHLTTVAHDETRNPQTL